MAGVISAALAEQAVERGVLASGMTRVGWMAQVHTDAMQEGMASRSAIRQMSPQARCARLEQIVRNSIPEIKRQTGITNQAFYEAQVAGGRTRNGCASAAPLSFWGSPAAVVMTGDSVTGDFLEYTAALDATFSAGGTPSEVIAGMEAVLASASSLGEADYAVLSGIVSIAASSVDYWYSTQQGGGFMPEDPPEFEMSIFRAVWCPKWCRVGWADLTGTVMGAAAVIATAGPGALVTWGMVVGGAAVGAIWNSLNEAM